MVAWYDIIHLAMSRVACMSGASRYSKKTSNMQRSSRRQPATTLIIVLLSACVIVGACGFGSVLAIQRQWVRGPELNLRVGTYQLIAHTTTRPECITLPLQECFITFPIPFTAPRLRYTVWFGQITRISAPNAATAVVTTSQGRVLVDLPISP